MWEVDSRLCGKVRFKYHEDLPEIDPLERIGIIVSESSEGEILKCERDRDQEFQRCNEFIKRGALVQRRGALVLSLMVMLLTDSSRKLFRICRAGIFVGVKICIVGVRQRH